MEVFCPPKANRHIAKFCAFAKKMQKTFDGQHIKLQICRFYKLKKKTQSIDEDTSPCHLLKLDNTLNSLYKKKNK